jgi:hypothetical protein
MLTLLTLALALAVADAPAVLESAYAPHDFALAADPASAEWAEAPRVSINRDYLGTPIDGRPTEVRSRWTDEHLYLLFICPYDELNLNPTPALDRETPRLWDRDVAEAFIGFDHERIWQYKEFQVSPQGEWLDMDIDRREPSTQGGMDWNSGIVVRGRIDRESRTWYGEMRIPFRALDTRPRAGTELRLGLFRIANTAPRTYYAWRPTGRTSFHVPEEFGTLRLR